MMVDDIREPLIVAFLLDAMSQSYAYANALDQ